ncbi:hypothetical protein PPYR_13321 [Photinus pyralis]|uniref:Uncharacterized protein n=1 Tax=Photinus pyralis TaxID=7054 RepID=A0A1Y1LJ75_PHOPY|nr:hypothetical protein PPYR_13321 [Photinus pyralis]
MKILLTLCLISSIHAINQVDTFLRRPTCVCTGKITAIMHDINGAYCMYYGTGVYRKWECENTEDWDQFLRSTPRRVAEPTCQCTSTATGIMQDETGTYCVYNGVDKRTRWECENTEEWDLYKRNRY